jgi:PPM family protein phosphatase
MQSNNQTTPSARNDAGPVHLDVAHRSEIGKVRTENQDFSLVSSGPDGPGDGTLMIVADGMGGHRGGATASRLAAMTVREQFSADPLDDPGPALSTAIERANQAVFEQAQGNPELRGMGTTVSVLYARDSRAWFSHVGDSRIYRLRQGLLEQLTQDHSVVASMVREGLLTDEEAAVHPRRNVLQRSLGVTAHIESDSSELELLPGDTYLLCSDGLHGFVGIDSIREALELPTEEAVDRCVELAYDAGAPDNVTVVVCRVAVPQPATNAAGKKLRWLWLLAGLGFAGALIWLWSRFGQGVG